VFLDKNSITINGLSIGQYIVEAKYGYHKLWGKDTGRNLAGENSGSLLGIFPKITLQFRKLTKAELQTIAPILDSATQTVVYYDPNLQRAVSMETYTGDWEIVNKNTLNSGAKNEGFSIAFISVRKRS
jgi:hypothetical protein